MPHATIERLTMQCDIVDPVMHSARAREGTSAFAEKGRPNRQNR